MIFKSLQLLRSLKAVDVGTYTTNWARWQGGENMIFYPSPRFNPSRLGEGYDIIYYSFWSIYRTHSGCQMHSPDYGTDFISWGAWNSTYEDPIAGIFLQGSEHFDQFETTGLLDEIRDVADSMDGSIQAYRRQQQNGRKLILSLGGWTLSKDFSYCLNDEHFDQTMAHVDKQVQRFGKWFDGIELDWEYPVEGGLYQGTPGAHHPNDWYYAARFLREMKSRYSAHFNGHAPFTSFAARANYQALRNIEEAAAAICAPDTLDQWNLMSYDLFGMWSEFMGNNAAMYRTLEDAAHSDPIYDGNSVSEAAFGYKTVCPNVRLAVGMPMYGRTINMWYPSLYSRQLGMYGAGPAGDHPERGIQTFRGTSDLLDKNLGEIIWDMGAGATYYSGDRQRNEGDHTSVSYHDEYFTSPFWTSIDTPLVIAAKTKWAIDNGFEMVFFWDATTDDVQGTLGNTAQRVRDSGSIPNDLLNEIENGKWSGSCYISTPYMVYFQPSDISISPVQQHKSFLQVLVEAGVAIPTCGSYEEAGDGWNQRTPGLPYDNETTFCEKWPGHP